jgi:hypothetical protein
MRNVRYKNIKNFLKWEKMKTARMLTILFLAGYLMLWTGQAAIAGPVGTAFTYQGRVLDFNEPANGICDFRFMLFGSPDAEDLLDGRTIEDVPVVDGFFTVELDFPQDVFDGNDRWLEIGVRAGQLNEPNEYTVLSPRQRIAPTPYALYALSGTPGPGDNLGNHTATQNVSLNGHWLSYDGSDKGIYVDSLGDVGIGTQNPGWDMQVCGKASFLNTSGSGLIIEPGVPATIASWAGGIYFSNMELSWGRTFFYGKVGINIPNLPDYTLDVAGEANLNKGETGVALRVNGDEAIWYDGTYFSWGYGGTANYFADPVGIGTKTPNGALDVNGSIYQRGAVLHADYVFEPDYKLETIEEHSEFMWRNKHLKAIPKAKVDENGLEIVEVGSHRKGVVEELEKAYIYIEQLSKQNKILEARLVKLEAVVAQLNIVQKGEMK